MHSAHSLIGVPRKGDVPETVLSFRIWTIPGKLEALVCLLMAGLRNAPQHGGRGCHSLKDLNVELKRGISVNLL